MASIGDNTRALQEILTAVQNLPEGGGSSDFESGEWVVPSTLTTGTTHVICTLKKYPRAFILLGNNIIAANAVVFSTMVPINSYGDNITSTTSMRKICAYNGSVDAVSYTNTTADISTSAVGKLHVTATFDVRIGANTTYSILAGTYKWFAIY